MATKAQVAQIYQDHPDWTVKQVAEALNCLPEYVRATSHRGGYRFLQAHEQKELSLRQAARALLDRYVQLVSSGDCGFWEAEEEAEVIALRKVLGYYK